MRSKQFLARVRTVPRALVCAALAAQFALSAALVDISTPIPNDDPVLAVSDVNTIIAQAVGALKAIKQSGIIAVTDREGHILAIFRMNFSGSTDPRINEQATVKARTAAFFESNADALTSRTAQFIIQSNFPPGIRFVDAGPLFGVPFSNHPGSDVQLQVPPAIVFVNLVNAPGALAMPPGTANTRPLTQPLVITPLTDDPGGIPIFVGKKAAGAVGIEIDGFGVLANGVPDAGVMRTDTGIIPGPSKQLLEEAVSLSAIKGYEPPAAIVATHITVNGFRFPYVKTHAIHSTAVPVASLPVEGTFQPYFDTDGTERSPSGAPLPGAYTGAFDSTVMFQLASKVTMTAPRGTPTQEFPKQGFVGRFPPRDSPLGVITKADVLQMVQQAADQAFLTRAAIRNPKGLAAQVWISVVDIQGNICGVFRTSDATVFSFDLAVQKARTAAFFSTDTCGFSSRAIGFMSQTFYPPGVSAHPPGPISGLLEHAGGNAGDLGLNPTGDDAANLTEISQLLTDRTTNTLGALASSLAPPFPPPAGKITLPAVQLLARRIPHIRDGRISPLQASITVDMTLRAVYTPPQAPPPTLKDGITLFPGGVPIYKNGVLVGGLGVSGDGVDQDDVIVFNGHRGFEPPDGVRCDQVDEATVKAALQAAIPKLKTEFPALTNGSTTSPEVIDVVEQRLNTGEILQGLRLPYVKFPRSSNRK
ncbi:MAG TPA: heme-binding protein [Planctomycetota bacterium]|nr:heme-binding protein [Planctomycetota bacterium]